MLTDTGTTFRLYPERPVIAYRKFKINKDNYFTILDDKTILSDIDLLADDGTGLKVYSDRTDSLSDITVSVNRLNLGELTSSIPYAPDIAGLLSGDFHIVRQESQITAAYDLNVQDMNYAGAPLGNIGAVGTYMPMASENSHFVNVSLTSEGNEVASLDGVYHGQTDSVKATLQLLHFPTAMLNGFTGETLSLGGALDGNLELTGTTSHPLLNGKMLLDSVRLYSEVYGFDMLVGNDSAVINNSVLNIDTLNLYSAGNNPLVVDGVINFADLSSTARSTPTWTPRCAARSRSCSSTASSMSCPSRTSPMCCATARCRPRTTSTRLSISPTSATQPRWSSSRRLPQA
jgi:hypothetical protein